MNRFMPTTTPAPVPHIVIGTAIGNALSQVPGSEFVKNTIDAVCEWLNAFQMDMLRAANINVSSLSSSTSNAVSELQKSIRSLGDGFQRLYGEITKLSCITELPSAIIRSNFLSPFTEVISNIVSSINSGGISASSLLSDSMSTFWSIFPAIAKDMVRSPALLMSFASVSNLMKF